MPFAPQGALDTSLSTGHLVVPTGMDGATMASRSSEVFIPTMTMTMSVYLDFVMDGSAKLSSGSIENCPLPSPHCRLPYPVTVFLELP